MEIQLNGTIESVTCRNIAELIATTDYKPDALIVELNRQIIKQENWPTTSLNAGDQVELLSFVGGG